MRRSKYLAVLTLFSLLILPAYVDGAGGKDPGPGVADIRDAFLAAVNQARSVNRKCGHTSFGPAPPVSWSDNLAMAAYLHSKDMVRKNFLSHTGSDGSSAGQRISRLGYPWRTYGENIAAGDQTVSSVIRGWLESERHCRNLMNPAFTEIGAGYAIGPFGGNPAARYWTFDLADR
ncbi:MAG: CAP domain-containing protein [bacterium]|nr:CAP domain-containing protein [bacterium]